MRLPPRMREILLRIREYSIPQTVVIFRQKNLLCSAMACQQCHLPMLERFNGTVDGVAWCCRHPSCPKYKITLSIRTGSFFESSKIPLSHIWVIVLCWLDNVAIEEIVRSYGYSRKIVIRVFYDLRARVQQHLIENPIQLGGTGIVCQMDETLLTYRSKYNRGHRAREQIWCFGIVDTSFVPAKGYIEIVSNRARETLFEIIKRVCRPNSILHSDEWAAYRTIEAHNGFVHATVNHKLNFVDPGSGVHTQHIESYWNCLKRTLKSKHGIKGNLRMYLAEFTWKYQYRE